MKFKLKDIKPNPFRHLDHYPIKKDKITALRESIRRTGFWDNLIGRKTGNKVEIAFGHHRLYALNEEFDPDHQIEVNVRELSDEDMLQLMAHENQEEWGATASVEQETVRAVVVAYAEGKINLPKCKSNNPDHVRYAPSFVKSTAKRLAVLPKRPYTAEQLAEFLGWRQPNGVPKYKLKLALRALESIEEGTFSEQDFEDLSRSQVKVLLEQSRKSKKIREVEADKLEKVAAEAERNGEYRQAEFVRQKAAASREEGKRIATKVGKALSEEFKKKGKDREGVRSASMIAAEVDIREIRGREVPDINRFTEYLIKKFAKLDEKDIEKLAKIVEFRDHLVQDLKEELAGVLTSFGNNLLFYGNQLSVSKPNQTKPKTVLPLIGGKD